MSCFTNRKQMSEEILEGIINSSDMSSENEDHDKQIESSTWMNAGPPFAFIRKLGLRKFTRTS